MKPLLHILPIPTLTPEIHQSFYLSGFIIAGVSKTSLDTFNQICDCGNGKSIICNEFYFGEDFQELKWNERLGVVYRELLHAALQKKDILVFANAFFGPILYDLLQNSWIEDLKKDAQTEYKFSIDSSLVTTAEEVETAIAMTTPLVVAADPDVSDKEYKLYIKFNQSVRDCIHQVCAAFSKPLTEKLAIQRYKSVLVLVN